MRTRAACFLFVLVSVVIAACTTQVVQSGPEASDGGTSSTLPPISADKLGKTCSGFGTSVGDTAAFKSADCQGGICLVDGRTIESYCSADCDVSACPAGYLCQSVTLGAAKRACFRDPNAKAPDASAATVEQLYFVSCLTALAVGDKSKVLRFYAASRSSGDTLTLDLTPLKTSATKVSKAQSVGTPNTTSTGLATDTGRFNAVFSQVYVDGSANPFIDRPLTIAPMTLEGDKEAGRFCAKLGGAITAPIQQRLDPSTDVCVFVPVNEGDAVPPVQASEYACTLP